MNKKWLLVGAVAVAAFATTTAFKGKTLEEQKAEIQTAVTAKLDEFRMQKDEECTTRVTAEAQTRFTQWMAEEEAYMAANKGKKRPATKKTPPSGGTTPLPPVTPPTNPTTKQEGMDAGGKTEQKKKQMDGPASNTESKKKKMDAPGGGGN